MSYVLSSLACRKVAKNFTEVFKELVPEGRASLVMQRRRDEQPDEEEQQVGDISLSSSYSFSAIT